MIKKREKSVLKNLNLKNTLFSLFYNGLMEIYFTPDFKEPFFWNRLIDIINNKLKCIQDADQTEIKQDYYLNKLIEVKEDEYIDQAVPSELHIIIDEDI